MSRRIEVELTSDRGDGTLTWRAAGAKAPKGVLSATLLPAGVKVGDTVKVDADYDMEGVTIVAVLPPAEKKQATNVIEFIGAPPPPPRDYSKEPERRERKGGRRGERKGGGRDRHRDGGERGERRERPPRPDRPEKPKLPPKPKAPRLRAKRTHRDALLASLPEEQRPVAEQVLKGGIPAVRAAIEEQNAAAKAAGQPPVKADALLALAESIVPKARVAEWRDRAEAAIEQIDTVDLRDLRSVVTKADAAAKDDETRDLAERLRTGLAARLEKEQAAWLAEIGELLDDDRVVRALNVSSRPPKAGTPLPRDLAERLAAAAGAALTDQIGAKRWATVLEALSLSPVHAQVTPASVPTSPNEELLEAVKRFSMQVPQIAALFGIEPTKAPRSRGPRRARPGAGGDKAKPKAPRIPPPPPIDGTPAPEAPTEATAPVEGEAVAPEATAEAPEAVAEESEAAAETTDPAPEAPVAEESAPEAEPETPEAAAEVSEEPETVAEMAEESEAAAEAPEAAAETPAEEPATEEAPEAPAVEEPEAVTEMAEESEAAAEAPEAVEPVAAATEEPDEPVATDEAEEPAPEG